MWFSLEDNLGCPSLIWSFVNIYNLLTFFVWQFPLPSPSSVMAMWLLGSSATSFIFACHVECPQFCFLEGIRKIKISIYVVSRKYFWCANFNVQKFKFFWTGSRKFIYQNNSWKVFRISLIRYIVPFKTLIHVKIWRLRQVITVPSHFLCSDTISPQWACYVQLAPCSFEHATSHQPVFPDSTVFFTTFTRPHVWWL